MRSQRRHTQKGLHTLCSEHSSSLQHSTASLQPLQVNNDLVLVKSILSCQPTVHICQKTLNHPLNRECSGGLGRVYWTCAAWRLSRKADLACLPGTGRASFLFMTPSALSSSQATDPTWWMMREGLVKKTNLQLVNLTEMIFLLCIQCKYAGLVLLSLLKHTTIAENGIAIEVVKL